MTLTTRKGLRVGIAAVLATAVLPIALVALQDDDSPVINSNEYELQMEEDAQTELTVEQIEEMMLGGRGARSGGEADEAPEGVSIFGDAGMRQGIFGTNQPKFVYINQGADPMIIPWIRSAIVAQELWERATTLRSAGEGPEALMILQQLIDQVPESPEARNAPQMIDAIRKEIDGPAPGTGAQTPVTPDSGQVTIPNEVVLNTTGILISGTPKVLVFDYILEVGDRIPRYAGIRVKAISASQVVYEYEGQEFAVDVDGRF